MNKKRIAIIGGGPAGFMAAITAANFAQVDIYEKNVPLKTLLWTGNGRCNLTNDIADFKELASHFPRGEKFLYSIFSRFGARETLDWFNSRGLKTYKQSDNRIFPQTNMAATVRELLLKEANIKRIKIIKSCMSKLPLKDYDSVIIATGGKGCEIARKTGHTIIPLKPSLTSLFTNEPWIKGLAGVSVQNARVMAFKNNKKISDLTGDFVFTHKGLSGPVILDTSAYCAYTEPPYILKINFAPDFDLSELDSNKSISNTIKTHIPKSLAVNLLEKFNINPDKKAFRLTKVEKQNIFKMLQETEIKIISADPEGAMVTAGGINLKEINPKTMESKLNKGLYFSGEVLDIDGLTGGFNLQMCWSTGYIAGLYAGKGNDY